VVFDDVVVDVVYELGGLDCFVVNVGGIVGGNLFDSIVVDFIVIFEFNVGYVVVLVKVGYLYFVCVGGGVVVFIMSIIGLCVVFCMICVVVKVVEIYFVWVFVDELVGDWICVNVVSLGSILFEGGGWDLLWCSDFEVFVSFEFGEFLWGWLGCLEEVVDVVMFLLFDCVLWVMGVDVVVDGAQYWVSVWCFW